MFFGPQDALAPTPTPMTPIPTTLPMAMSFPMTTTTTSPTLATSGSTAGASYSKKPTLQTVERVRQAFPESWIWTDVVTG